MKKLVLTILIWGLWGMVGNCEVAYDSVLVCDTANWITDEGGGFDVYCWYNHVTYDPAISLSSREEFAEDSLYVKHCRVDTIGWVAKVCQTYFTWEPLAPDFGTGCAARSGDGIYAVANKLVWNRKEKPPTMQWVVRTKTTCWYVLTEE